MNCNLLLYPCYYLIQKDYKLDMETAYDHVSWEFVYYMLEMLGFGIKWKGWISDCMTPISFCCYSEWSGIYLFSGIERVEIEKSTIAFIVHCCHRSFE